MIQSTISFQSALKAARRVSTPLIAIRTVDPASAIQIVAASVRKSDTTPILQWDIMRGLGHVNEAGKKLVAQMLDGQSPEAVGPTDVLALGHRLPEDTILIAANFHRCWNEPPVVQGVWNLRDAFKANGRALLMLATAFPVMAWLVVAPSFSRCPRARPAFAGPSGPRMCRAGDCRSC